MISRAQHNIEIAIVIFFMGIALYGADPTFAKFALSSVVGVWVLYEVIDFFL